MISGDNIHGTAAKLMEHLWVLGRLMENARILFPIYYSNYIDYATDI